jgi:hypothetical protein
LLAFLPLVIETLWVGLLNIKGARDAGKRSVLGEYVKQKKGKGVVSAGDAW